MTAQSFLPRKLLRAPAGDTLSAMALAAVLYGVMPGMAAAQPTAQPDDAQYQAALQQCEGMAPDSRDACRKEAAAVQQEIRQGRRHPDANASYRLNRQSRCDHLPAQQRQDCLRLMSDPQATTRGSVDGGGILRETVIPVPAAPAPAAPAARPSYDAPTPAQPLPVN